MKIAIISCYDQIDYVRALTLRQAFAEHQDLEVLVIKNKHKGLLRYAEVPIKILRSKLKDKPDAFVITFRGYEMLPFCLMVKGHKPLIFDEYINAAEYLAEHNTLKLHGRLSKLFLAWYRSLLKSCFLVLADTKAHAEFSAELCRLPISKFLALPVGTDESLFNPQAAKHSPDKNGKFRVFYYGVNMPLHGLEYIMQAAVALAKTHPHIEFTLSDPKGKNAQLFQSAIDQGANLKVITGWLPFKSLPKLEIEADLCLGGPYGKTLQSQFVVTTKTYQYLACAVPALIAKNKTVSEGFVDKQNCLLVPQADGRALANAIAWAAEHSKELVGIGQAGRKLYQSKFSHTKIKQEVATVVEGLKNAVS